MNHTFIDEKSLKNLEDYAVFLTSGILTLNTLHNLQVRGIEIGILSEDMAERSNTILWDLRRLMKHYQNQLESVLECLPDTFNAASIIETMKQKELVRARAMTKKPRVKK